MARTCTVAALMLALAAPSAQASSVHLEPDGIHYTPVYIAAPGEANDVLVSQVDGRTMRIADPGASTIRVGSDCVPVDEHTVDCSAPQGRAIVRARVSLGDGDDAVRVAIDDRMGGDRVFVQGAGLDADGGPGSDVLLGGLVKDDLNGGGGGHDVLKGGDNGDLLADGDTTGVDVDADEFDGGRHGATISYANRSAPVKVDLIRSIFGEAGEGDVARDVDSASGGSRDDVLAGDEQLNLLIGGEGDDRIVGRGGPDSLFGGSGDDRLYGQGSFDAIYGDADDLLGDNPADPGNDVISGGADSDYVYGGPAADVISGGADRDYLQGDTGADAISCGSGDDVARQPQVFDYLKRGCERVTLKLDPKPGEEDVETLMVVGAYPVSIRRRSATFVVGCPQRVAYDDGTCNAFRGRLTLRDSRGRRLGSGPIAIENTSPPETKVAVRLNRRGRRLIARPRGARVVVAVAGDRLPAKRWTVLLRTER